MGLVDFAIGLLNSVLNLPEGQVKLNLRNSNYEELQSMLAIKKFWGLVKKTLGLLHTSDNLPGWQAVKLTFF